MGVTEAKHLLSPFQPALLGRYPDRPAPAHVLNAFVAAGFGVSPDAAKNRRFVAGTSPLEERPPFIGPGVTDDELQQLRADLSIIFNADRRMWADVGSPFPVHSRLATSDPSDDGLGAAVWAIFSTFATDEERSRLSSLISPALPNDVVTALAKVVVADSADGGSAVPTFEHAWFGPNGTHAGNAVGARLSAALCGVLAPTSDARRLQQIVELSRAAYLIAFLGALYGPVAAADDQANSAISELGMLVVWADVPPGNTSHPFVLAAAQSFRAAVQRHQAALRHVAHTALDASDTASQLPADMRLQAKVRAALARAGVPQSRIDAEARAILVDIGELAGGAGSRQAADALVAAAYPEAFLVRGFRSMGRKVGIVGPDRGAGTPRFMCESVLLGTIVHMLCPPSGMDLETLVDAAREKLGLVFGSGTATRLETRLGLWESAATGRRLLRDNQDALRRRLLRAGLARQYSDGHTEVMPNDPA